MQMSCPPTTRHFSIFANRIMLLLSWYIVVVGTYWPCAMTKHLVHRTWAIESFIATSSASMELLMLSFCLLDVKYATPLPKVINIPL